MGNTVSKLHTKEVSLGELDYKAFKWSTYPSTHTPIPYVEKRLSP